MTQGPKGVKKISLKKPALLPQQPPMYAALFDEEAEDEDYFAFLQAFRSNMRQARKDKDPDKYIPRPPLKVLAFKGGGAKGGVYPGAIRALEEQGFLDEVDTVIGASAGAITAFIVGMGFSSEQFKALSKRVKFTDFTDVKPEGWAAFFNGNKVGNLLDLLHYGSVYTGEAFHDWASYMVEQILGSPNATFADLYHARMLDPSLKNMVFKATRYNAKNGELIEQTFSYFDTPHIRIADALTASMSFPGAFSPKTVRYKNGKVFGVFADGGILNNYPVEEANRNEFMPEHYKPIEKMDIHGKAHKINPAVVGCKLVTHVEQLDEEQTPFSPRIKRIRQERMQQKKRETKKVETQVDIHAQIEEADATWHFNDIFNAIVWHKIGRPVKEDLSAKQALYKGQNVQIWVEDIGTLEFDAPKSKLKRLYQGGKSAMRLWLDKFKDPAKPYDYPDQFDDRETSANKELKKSSPENYYLQKLTDYYIALFHEMKKAKLQHKRSDATLHENVRMQYLCRKIDETINSMHKKDQLNPEAIERQAFRDAKQKVKRNKMELQQQREKRNLMLNDNKLIGEIADKLINNPSEGLRMLKGQLSRVISLIRTPKGSNLLSIAVQTGNPQVAQEVFKIVQNALDQCYYQGRTEDIKYTLAQMLNEFATPPLFKVLFGPHRVQMTNLLLKYGASPLLINTQSQTCGLQDVIANNDFESFKAIIEYCNLRHIDVKNIRIGDKSIGHCILQSADESFIKKCLQDEKLSRSFLNYHFKDGNYNDIVHEAARICDSPSELAFELVKAFSPKANLNFDSLKKEAHANYEAHTDKRESASETFEAIMQASSPQDRINITKPQVCLQILTSYIKGTGVLRLCNLARNESTAEVFMMLCERIYSNSVTRKHLHDLLSQKINGKTPLYMAAEAGNTQVVKYLRLPKYDAQINNAGPIDEPCALLAAAKNGHNEVVSALMDSIPYGLRIGYHSVSRRRPNYQDKQTALHYLGMYGSPKAFCDVLYGGGMRSEPSKVACMKDKRGKTPLSYIIEYNRMDILEEILNKGKGARRGLLLNSDYRFATVFGWQSESFIEDLVRAKMFNPSMYTFICEHLSGNKTKAAKIMHQVEKRVAEIKERSTSTIITNTQESIKLEMAKIDAQEYDDWVIMKPEEKHVRATMKQHFEQFKAAKSPTKLVMEKEALTDNKGPQNKASPKK